MVFFTLITPAEAGGLQSEWISLLDPAALRRENTSRTLTQRLQPRLGDRVKTARSSTTVRERVPG